MEKQSADLTILKDYRKRQVILNYYRDEDFLWQRDGFHFESVETADNVLMFTKGDGSIKKIPLKNYPSSFVDNSFPNYFIFRNGEDRLEIYFP